jgi:hypothetical protein
MKKLLLSSVIMLGICGIASAQTGSKLAKQTATTSSAAPTPQKSASAVASDVAAPAAVVNTTSDDQQAASATPAKTVRVAKTEARAQATTVNAAGEVVPASDAKRVEEKVAANKAAATKTGKQN